MAKAIVNRIDRHLARRLREARREVGLSTRAVAAAMCKRCSVSHTTIAHYEGGKSLPSIDVLAALADVYRRPLNWFLESRECLSDFRYHNLPSRVSVADRRCFEATAGKWADAYIRLYRHLGLARKSCSYTPKDGVSPQLLAAEVRRECLDLDDKQPIPSVVEALERFSAWAIEIRTQINAEGAAARHGESTVVVLDPGVSADRLRLNVACELAFILSQGDAATLMGRDSQQFAFEFGASLLIPHSQLKEAFVGKSFLRLIDYRERFGVSLLTMVYMAEQRRIINSTASRWLRSELSRRNWMKCEPGSVWRDRAIQFEIALESALSTKALTWSGAEAVTSIRQDELRARLAEATAFGKVETGESTSPATLRIRDSQDGG